MAPERQISDLITSELIPELREVFEQVDDAEQIGVVKGGRLQDNPNKLRIYACVHVGDPDDPEGWRDSLHARREQALDRSMFDAPGFEIGGGTNWWRRFSIEWGFFGLKTKEDYDEAERIAMLTKGRLERAIATSRRITGQRDSLGEVSILAMAVTSFVEQGGSKRGYIWRGKVQFQVLTQAPY